MSEVGTMVESFSRTFVSWLDGRLAADVYINASSDTQATEIKAWLHERPEVEAILPGAEPTRKWAARRSKFSACPITPFIAIAGHCSIQLQTPGYACVPATPGLISEQLARRLKLAIGDRVDIPAPEGKLDARGGRHLRRLRQSEGTDLPSISRR